MTVAALLGTLVFALGTDGSAAAAADPAKQSLARPDNAHNSRNSLDWAGLYEGVLPCADCPGIKMQLSLARDGRYELAMQYLDRDVVPRLVYGHFTWHTSGNAITLDAAGGGQQFAVGEGRLTQLDRAGAPIRSPNGVLTLVAAADVKPTSSGLPAQADLARILQAYRWQLESATDREGRPIAAVMPAAGRAFTFAFSNGRALVEGGCNSMRGGYRIANGRLELGRMAATMKACEPALMQADAALVKLLAAPLKVMLTTGAQPKLELTTPANDTLVLAGQPTPESLYGKGTLMFLEVAAFRVPCNHPTMPNATCLQVRERKYDARGLQAGKPGEWTTFYGAIEGFTHTEGERSVLRVKRFQRSPVPADASRFVYVLDLKVESEIVPRR